MLAAAGSQLRVVDWQRQLSVAQFERRKQEGYKFATEQFVVPTLIAINVTARLNKVGIICLSFYSA